MEEDESAREQQRAPRHPPPVVSHTRPSRSGTGPPATPTRSQGTPRSSARVVSTAAPRASLIRRTSKPPISAVPTAAVRKAKETQRRLGVGRPTAVGGSGARKSTSRPQQQSFQRPNHIVEVVLPSLKMLREEREVEKGSLRNVRLRVPAA